MRSSIAIILILLSTSVLAQEEKCDDSVLSQINANMNKLTSSEIRMFLAAFDVSCKNNVEFSEFSNELLFRALEKHTKKVLLVLEKQYPEIQLKTILNVLEYPLVDTINLNDLIQKIEKVKASEQLKAQITNALQVSNNQ